MKSLHLTIWIMLLASFVAGGCGEDGSDETAGGYPWQLPEGFPRPEVPEDNPMSVEKVELGRHLFYDKRLSADESMSCASCHEQGLAFTDGKDSPEGITGQLHPRSSMSLVNVGYAATLNWANPVIFELKEQALTPIFGDDPVELGMPDIALLEERLRDDSYYREAFVAAYPEADEAITVDRAMKALASFQRTLISGNSRYDQYNRGDADALTASEKRGRELFFSERLECFHCHGGFNFSDSLNHESSITAEIAFHNNGLYNLGGDGDYPRNNQGLFEFTGDEEDKGKFRAPSLRNIAVTAPYMHDGSILTLSDVVDHYARGGRLIESGPYAGDGAENPNKSSFVSGFIISDQEKQDLIAFLQSLTDEEFLAAERFSNPWEE
jgi:cytochrome c peroxidase